MLLPHILGSVLVAVRSISTSVYESVRWASSEMLSRNFVTLALLTFVLSSVILMPPWLGRHCVQFSFFANTRIWRTVRPPNGLRYPLVGRTGRRYFDGINFKPRKCLKTRRLPPVGCTLC